MSHNNDSIAALLPVKNGEEFLAALLPSILSMLEPSDELVVVNDGSTDSTREIIEHFQVLDTRIKLINTSGVGLVSALNLGLSEVTCNWVARFDVDDQYANNRISQQRKMIKIGVAVVFSDYRFTSASGISLGVVPSAISPLPMALSLVSGQRTAHPVALINRKFLEACGNYKAEDFPVEDLALWLRLSKMGELVSVPDELLFYRLTRGSISSQNRQTQRALKGGILRRFDFWDQLQRDCILQFDTTLEQYMDFPKSRRRIFLHIRDLFLVSRFTGLKVSLLQIFRKMGGRLSFEVLLSGALMGIFALIRRTYRLKSI